MCPTRKKNKFSFIAMKKNEILEDIFFRGDEKKHKNGEGIWYRMKECNFPSSLLLGPNI